MGEKKSMQKLNKDELTQVNGGGMEIHREGGKVTVELICRTCRFHEIIDVVDDEPIVKF